MSKACTRLRQEDLNFKVTWDKQHPPQTKHTSDPSNFTWYLQGTHVVKWNQKGEWMLRTSRIPMTHREEGKGSKGKDTLEIGNHQFTIPDNGYLSIYFTILLVFLYCFETGSYYIARLTWNSLYRWGWTWTCADPQTVSSESHHTHRVLLSVGVIKRPGRASEETGVPRFTGPEVEVGRQAQTE